MDITQNELKSMKAKQLRRIIREAIDEILNEADLSPAEQAAKQAEINALKAKKKAIDAKLGDIASGREEVAEGEIDEMARVAKGFRLADENIDTAQYANKRVSGTSLQDIINYFRENPGADKKSLQSQFNFARPQIANAVVNALLDAGVLVKLGAGGEVEATPEPGEETAPQATEPEDLFMGGAENPLSMYFDNEPNDDGSEDFTDETEPEAGELEKAEPTAGSMSDEDYEAFMKYDELKRRLDATKSNILKTRKSRGTAGDIADKPSTELVRLRDLKKSLEDRIDTLVAGSDYLKKKLAKQNPPPPVETPEEDETVAEGLDAYDMQKLQYYAGIRK
jgi:hypothetical protein